MLEFPSEPWFQALIEQINGSATYREAAATWEGGISFLIEAEPDKGVPADVWGFLDLWHGECRGGGLVDADAGDDAPFVIRAPYSRWKEVLQGDLDPTRAMMQGKLKVRGDLPTILRYVGAANELVFLTSQVDTHFPDED